MLSHALTFGIPHLDVPDVEGTHPGLYGAQVADHDDRGWLELQHPRRRGVAVHGTDRREPFTIAGVEVSGQPRRDPSRDAVPEPLRRLHQAREARDERVQRPLELGPRNRVADDAAPLA